MADAQSALTGAYDAAECAPEEYAAARKMLEKAQAASKAEEYDRARELAVTARDLARKAAKSAKARRGCSEAAQKRREKS